MRPTQISFIFLILLWQNTTTTAKNADSVEREVQFQTENAREIMKYAKAAEMRNYMNSKADACENFYEYACGNWAKINTATLEDAKTGIFTTFARSYDLRVARLLSEPKRSSESDMQRKVKYFFDSCLLNSKLSRKQYKEKLLSIMEEFGGMPVLKGEQWQEEKFDWLQTIALILRKYGKQIIVGVEVMADLTNNKANRLYIGQIENELVPTRAKDYYVHLKLRLLQELQLVLGLSYHAAAETARELVNFQMQLAAGISEPHEGLGMEDKTHLRLLEQMTETYKPMLNFTELVNTWLGYEYRSPVFEYVESYNRNLRTLIEETPKSVVANYIMWELLQDFRMEAEQQENKQMHKCVLQTKNYFIGYVDNMVYNDLLQQNDSLIEEIELMWPELKNAFKETFLAHSANWLSEKTREQAIEKLDAMTLEINAYEKEDFELVYKDLEISTDDYFGNVINILELRGRRYRQKLQEPTRMEESAMLSFTPAYAPEFNNVLIPVAFLQPRYLWHSIYPVALKYATFGYIIAHEMAHGFDDTIRKYDAIGNLNNWWDRESTTEYAKRKECFRQQYSEYKYGGRQLQKTNAQGENIADNVGVRIAYAAYQNWLLQIGSDSTELQFEVLPHLNLTSRQLFFVGVAQIWCTDVHRRQQAISAAIDVHAPEEVRVRAMLTNFDEFAVEFKCGAGSKMHPQQKCVLF